MLVHCECVAVLVLAKLIFMNACTRECCCIGCFLDHLILAKVVSSKLIGNLLFWRLDFFRRCLFERHLFCNVSYWSTVCVADLLLGKLYVSTFVSANVVVSNAVLEHLSFAAATRSLPNQQNVFIFSCWLETKR